MRKRAISHEAEINHAAERQTVTMIPNFDALHWFDPGLPDIDAVHWLPFMTSSELGLVEPKLTLDFEAEPPPIAKQSADEAKA